MESIIIFSIVSFLSWWPSSMAAPSSSNPDSFITAIYAFGDSTIDTGNNNYLTTDSRADHPPYGIDFVSRIPTGRFSNGKLIVDFIAAASLRKLFLPPYLHPRVTSNDLLTGASFGSAGSGLDPITAQRANVLSLTAQLDLFDEALTRIRRSVGNATASFIVRNALFLFSIGTDDFVNSFYGSVRSSQFTISTYQDFLLQNLQSAIQRLYNTGARRFVLTSLPPVGCLPLQVTRYSNTTRRSCVQKQNNDSVVYNRKLQLLTSRLETQVLQGSRIAYNDVYNPLLDFINNPAKYGFEQTLIGCCGTGLFEQARTCNASVPICPDRSKYVFFDALRPTQPVYANLARIALLTVTPHILGF